MNRLSKQEFKGLLLTVFICTATIGFIIAFCLSLVSMMDSTHQNDLKNGYYMPSGSTNIQAVGNDWVEFDYKGGRYLIHLRSGNPVRAIVRVGDAQVEAE